MRSCLQKWFLHYTSYEQKRLIFNKQSLRAIMKCIVFHYLCSLNFVTNACCGIAEYAAGAAQSGPVPNPKTGEKNRAAPGEMRKHEIKTANIQF